MANIALTKYCNLNCPYCFANSMISEEDKKYIDLNTFKKILDWIEKSPNEKRIGLIGGEPTLHPEFIKILNILNNFCEETGKESILFTNGINLEKFISYISPKMSVLINLNDPSTMSKQQLNNLNNSLYKLFKDGKLSGLNPQFSCGCNLSLKIKNYDFFWNYVDIFNLKKVRVSVTAPNNDNLKKNKEEYYKKMKKIFLDFIIKAKKRNVSVYIDCNHIPLCYFSSSENEIIKKVCNDIYDGFCEPCIDITPDFKATCCFGTYDSLIDCNLFDNCDELRNYFCKKIISKKVEFNNTGKCYNCNDFILAKCQGGCLSFSLTK